MGKAIMSPEAISHYKPTLPAPPRVCNCGPNIEWDQNQCCLRCGLPLEDTELVKIRRQRDELADALEALYRDLMLHLHGKPAPGHQQHIKDAGAVLQKLGR